MYIQQYNVQVIRYKKARAYQTGLASALEHYSINSKLISVVLKVFNLRSFNGYVF